MAQLVTSLPAMRETWVQSLGRENPLEKEMALHSSILAWKIPWTEEPGRLYSPCGHKESDLTERLTHSQNGIMQCLLIFSIFLPLELLCKKYPIIVVAQVIVLGFEL